MKGRAVLEVLAGVLGALAGTVGFLPFLLMGGKLRTKFIEDGAKKAGLMFLVPLISFILMMAMLLMLQLVLPQYFLISVLICLVVFLVGTIVVTFKQVKR
ncbi:MAG: hypothetical protein LBB35_03315 [Coriobacteriaceae bacterium]|nr:hypothetical protein [Coriobacteriaceae bacterium]